MVNEPEYVMIPVFKNTKERMDSVAVKNKTYDDFVNLLLDLFEKVKKP